MRNPDISKRVSALAKELDISLLKATCAVEAWQEATSSDGMPVAEELRSSINRNDYLCFRDFSTLDGEGTVDYNGRKYLIRGLHIYNNRNDEVFSRPSAIRNRIMAELYRQSGNLKKIITDGNAYEYVILADGAPLMMDGNGHVLDREPARTLLKRNQGAEEHTKRTRHVSLAAIWDAKTRKNRTAVISQNIHGILQRFLKEERKRLLDMADEAEAQNRTAEAQTIRSKADNLTTTDALSIRGTAALVDELMAIYDTEGTKVKKNAARIYSHMQAEGQAKLTEAEFTKHYFEQCRLVHDHIYELVHAAAKRVKYLDGIKLSLNATKTVNIETGQDDNQDSSDNMLEDEPGKEGWQVDFRTVEAFSTISEETKKALYGICMYNPDGTPVRDDMGHMVSLDPAYMHTCIMTVMKDMADSSEYGKFLDTLAARYPRWAGGPKGLVARIKADERLMATTYSDFRKDFREYWVSKNNNGKDMTVWINGSEDTFVLVQNWDANNASQRNTGTMPVFNRDGTVNRKNAEKVHTYIDDIYRQFRPMKEMFPGKKYPERRDERLSRRFDTGKTRRINEEEVDALLKRRNSDGTTVWEKFIDILRSIGVTNDEDSIYNRLVNEPRRNGNASMIENALEMVAHIVPISEERIGYLKTYTTYGKYTKDNPYRLFRGSMKWYVNKLVSMLAEVDEGGKAYAVTQNGNKRSSYVTPSYTGKMVKLLQNTMSITEEEYRKWMDEEFGQDELFLDHDTDEWRNDWLNVLYKCPNVRQYFRHKEVTDFGGKSFFELTDTELAEDIYREYMSQQIGIFSDETQGSDSANEEMMRLEGHGLQLATYPMPILSDTDCAEFITFLRDSTEGWKERLKLKMAETVLQEFTRILRSADRERPIAEGRTTAYANIDTGRGKQFCFSPVLNTIYVTMNTDGIWTVSQEEADGKELLTDAMKRLYNEGTALAEHNLMTLAEAAVEYVTEEDVKAMAPLFMNVGALVRKDGSFRNEDFENFVWNWRHASSQIVEIFATDPAQYKNAEDFQKRFKQVHSPANRLYTEATWNGERVSDGIERSITLDDEILVSSKYDTLKKILETRSKLDRDDTKYISEPAARKILDKYMGINLTDGQSFRTLPGYRKVMIMAGDGHWSDAMEATYHRLMDGEWSMDDMNVFMQPIKPFMYTQKMTDDGLGGKMRIGIQHKNSESILFALASAVSSKTHGGSWRLKELEQFMIDNNIDVVHFRSAVKVGATGTIDLQYRDTDGPIYIDASLGRIMFGDKEAYHSRLSQDGKRIMLHSVEELVQETDRLLAEGQVDQMEHDRILSPYRMHEGDVTKKLRRLIKNGDSKYIQKTSYNDYGIQNGTPEHFIDREQNFPTQLRRLIIEGVNPEKKYNVGGTAMDGKEIVRLYNNLISENVQQSFDDFERMMSDPEKLYERLQREILDSDRYNISLLDQIRLVDETDEDGKRSTGRKNFAIPLYDPTISGMMEPLLTSIAKNMITKQKITGGSCVQVSAFGLSDDLHMVYEDDGKDARVKYVECYLPAYTMEFFDSDMLVPDGNGGMYLDADKLPETLRRLIGLRIPTEDKYSIAPLYIKGFLPQNMGSTIMLPLEWTLLSGSDFDIDKMFVLCPTAERNDIYDMKKARKDFRKAHPEVYAFIFSGKDPDGTFTKEYGEFLDTEEAEKLVPDPADMTEGEVLNEIINVDDMPLKRAFLNMKFRSWLRNEADKNDYYVRTQWYRTGDNTDGSRRNRISKTKIMLDMSDVSDYQKKKVRDNTIIDIMYSILTSSETFSNEVHPGGFEDIQKTAAIIEIAKSAGSMKNLAKILGTNGNIGSVVNSMNVEKLSKLKEKTVKKKDLLSPGTYIDFHRQNMVGKSNLGQCAINKAGHATMSYLKITPQKLGLTEVFSFAGRTVKPGENIYDNVRTVNMIARNLAQFLGAAADTAKDPTFESLGIDKNTLATGMLLVRFGWPVYETGLFLAQPSVKAISQALSSGMELAEIIDIIDPVKRDSRGFIIPKKMDFSHITAETMLEDLVNAGTGTDNTIEKDDYAMLFLRLQRAAKKLSSLTLGIRGDTQNGALGPTAAESTIKTKNYTEASDILFDGPFYDPFSSETGAVQTFNKLGIQRAAELVSQYMPQMTQNFEKIVKSIAVNMTKDAFKSVQNAMMTQVMTAELAAAAKDRVDGAQTAQDVALAYISQFPDIVLDKIRDSTYQDHGKTMRYGDNAFLRMLAQKNPGKKCPVKRLVLSFAGDMGAGTSDDITAGWESLLYSGDATARELAENLAYYAILIDGTGYKPGGFGHLMPAKLKENLPGYMDGIYKAGYNMKEGLMTNDFIILWLRHNLGTDMTKKAFPSLNEPTTRMLRNSGAIGKDGINFGVLPARDMKYLRKIIDDRGNIKTYGVTIDGKQYFLVRGHLGEAKGIPATPLGFNGGINEYWLNDPYGINPIAGYNGNGSFGTSIDDLIEEMSTSSGIDSMLESAGIDTMPDEYFDSLLDQVGPEDRYMDSADMTDDGGDKLC